MVYLKLSSKQLTLIILFSIDWTIFLNYFGISFFLFTTYYQLFLVQLKVTNKVIN